jgi:hypothetical protein
LNSEIEDLICALESAAVEAERRMDLGPVAWRLDRVAQHFETIARDLESGAPTELRSSLERLEQSARRIEAMIRLRAWREPEQTDSMEVRLASIARFYTEYASSIS